MSWKGGYVDAEQEQNEREKEEFQTISINHNGQFEITGEQDGWTANPDKDSSRVYQERIIMCCKMTQSLPARLPEYMSIQKSEKEQWKKGRWNKIVFQQQVSIRICYFEVLSLQPRWWILCSNISSILFIERVQKCYLGNHLCPISSHCWQSMWCHQFSCS